MNSYFLILVTIMGKLTLFFCFRRIRYLVLGTRQAFTIFCHHVPNTTFWQTTRIPAFIYKFPERTIHTVTSLSYKLPFLTNILSTLAINDSLEFVTIKYRVSFDCNNYKCHHDYNYTNVETHLVFIFRNIATESG